MSKQQWGCLFWFLLIGIVISALERILVPFLYLAGGITVLWLALRIVDVIWWGIFASQEDKDKRKLEREALAREHEAQARDEEAKKAAALLQVEARRKTRLAMRDADVHVRPFEYKCAGHPNRQLALRYGIANRVKKENTDPNSRLMVDASTITLMKIERLSHATFLARLPAYNNRVVRVVIEPGTDYVKTFLPREDSWFAEHADLEEVLKDNPTFTLKELATFHVQKAVRSKGT
jgi:hypothetical protein